MPGSVINSFWIRIPWVIPFGSLLLGLLLTAFEARSIWNDSLTADRRRFEAACDTLWERLETKIEAYQQALERFQEFGANQWPMDQAKWETFILRLNPAVNYDALADLRFTTLTKPRLDHLKRIWCYQVGRRLDLRDPEEYHLALIPLVSNATDTSLLWENTSRMMPSRCPTALPDPELEATMAHSAATTLIRASHPRVIGMDVHGKTRRGVTFVIACFAPGDTSESEWERGNSSIVSVLRRFRLALGVLTGSISLDRMMEGVFGSGPQEICMELLEMEAAIKPLPKYSLVPRPMNQFPPDWAAHWGSVSDGLPWKPRFKRETLHPFYTRQMVARFYSTPLFEMQSTGNRAYTVLWMGSGLSLVVSVGLWTQIRGRRRALELAFSLEESRQLLRRSSELQARISRDLHDGTVQSLFAIELGLGRAARRLHGTGEAQLISNAIHEMDAMIRDLRGFLVELDPEISPSQQASSALLALVDRLQKATGRDVQFVCQPGADSHLKQADVVNLLQVAREGASNAIRHGGATQIRLQLSRDKHLTRLTVSDNGMGFELNETTFHAGGGLTNMRLRAEKMHGSVHVESEPGGPTHLHFEFKAYD